MHFHECFLLGLVLYGQIIDKSEAASLCHRITNAPRVNFPLLFAFVCVFGVHVFVWLELWHDV
jgi:hypothetical protein